MAHTSGLELNLLFAVFNKNPLSAGITSKEGVDRTSSCNWKLRLLLASIMSKLGTHCYRLWCILSSLAEDNLINEPVKANTNVSIPQGRYIV